MPDAAWQAKLGFTERLSSTMKIAQAYKCAFSSLNSAEVQNKAREVEELLFAKSWSKEDYDQGVSKSVQSTLQELKGNTLNPSEKLNDISKPTSGQIIGPYQSAIYHRSGLSSEIFKAWDFTMNSFVALKASILSQAKDSHIIKLLSIFKQSGDQFTLVLPFMPYTLEEVLDQCNIQSEDVISHLRDLFSALSHIHSLGIIHRDVKPSNILLSSPCGPAYLADFGIAWMSGYAASETENKKITDVGTTCYRPPELLFGYSEYDCSLDLWAAGCVVAEVLLGGKKTLFHAGPLGSELALIQSIFKTLGTPTSEIWPESTKFPDWGKMEFYKYPSQPWTALVPDASDAACDLLYNLVRYQSTERLRATKVLVHPFLKRGESRGHDGMKRKQ